MSRIEGILEAVGRAGWRPSEGKLNTPVCRYKHGARTRGLVFCISDDHAKSLFQKPCYYCGFLPDDGSLNGIDRVDSLVGYIQENVVPCCKRCNMAKGRWGVVEFLRWIDRMKGVSVQEPLSGRSGERADFPAHGTVRRSRAFRPNAGFFVPPES